MPKTVKIIFLSALILLFAFNFKINAQSRSHIDFRFKSLTKDAQQPRKGDKVVFTIVAEKKGTEKADKVRLVCKLRHYQVVDQEIDFTVQSAATITYSWNALPGDQTFKCIIDSNNLYNETSEDNNEIKLEFNVALPRLPNIPYKDFILIPDYSAPVVRFDGLPNARQEFKLPDLIPTKITLDSYNNTANIFVRNTGNGFSATWKYKLSWGESSPDLEFCEDTKSGIIKSYANFQITCPLSEGFFSKYSEKNLQFKVMLDFTNKIEEIDEVNNLYFESIKVRQAQPKIVIN